MSKIYRLLKHYGFKKGDLEHNSKIISKLNEELLVALIEGLFTCVKTDNMDKESGLFEFQAGGTTSGGSIPCSSFNCRMKQLKKTLDFSVLYADKTTLKSPMDYHVNNLFESGLIDIEGLLFDIESLFIMEPLINKNIITFYSEYNCICLNCYKSIKSKENKIRELIMSKELSIDELVKNGLNYDLQYQDGSYYVRVFENSKYGFDHEMDVIIKDASFLSESFSDIELNNIKISKEVSLSSRNRDFLFEKTIVPVFLEPILNDIFYSKLFFEGTGKTYLSDRFVDGDIIKTLSNSLSKNSNISDAQLLDKIEYSFPYVEDSDYKKLIKMREYELDSFKVFRDEFSKEIRNVDLTNNNYREFQRDIIQPKINKINNSIHQNKKYIREKRFENVKNGAIYPIITFSLGKYFGIDMLANLSLTTLSASSQISKIIEKPTKFDVRNEDYYFLWKVQNAFK